MLEIYEIEAGIKSVLLTLEALEDEDSVLVADSELYQKLHALKMDRALLIAGMGRAFKNYKAELDAIAREKKKIEEKRAAAENRVERCKRWLLEHMEEGEKYKDAALSIYWMAKQPKLVIDDLESVPWEYLRVEPRKKDIKEIVDDVDWARMEEQDGKNIVVR